jgi:hypothetical protein
MRQLPIGAPVRVLESGPEWARGAAGKVAIDLGGDKYLVEFDESQIDDFGDGPFSGAPFSGADLTAFLE